MENRNEEFVQLFLAVLGKKDCAKIEGKIRQTFGLYSYSEDNLPKLEKISAAYIEGHITKGELDQDIIQYHDENPISELCAPSMLTITSAMCALDCLYWTTDSKEIEYLSEFASNNEKLKKIKHLHKSLAQMVTLSQDKDIQQYFQLKCNDEGYGDDRVASYNMQKYNSMFKHNLAMYHKVDAFLKINKNNKGKPSLDSFYNFSYEVACLYQALSGKPFKSDRHKNSNGKYVPMTEGMDFVWVAVDWLNDKAKSKGILRKFTSTNIVHACEKARTKILSTSTIG